MNFLTRISPGCCYILLPEVVCIMWEGAPPSLNVFSGNWDAMFTIALWHNHSILMCVLYMVEGRVEGRVGEFLLSCVLCVCENVVLCSYRQTFS